MFTRFEIVSDIKFFGVKLITVDGIPVAGLQLVHDDLNNDAIVWKTLGETVKIKNRTESNGRNWKCKVIEISPYSVINYREVE